MKGIRIFKVCYFMCGIAWMCAIIALMIIAQPEQFTYEMCVGPIIYAISWIANGIIACLCTKE